MSIKTASLAMLAGLTFAAPTAAFAAPTAPVVAHVEKSVKPAPAAQQAATDYAQREAADQQVADYVGGNTVVIGISGGTLVVLLLLLLII